MADLTLDDAILAVCRAAGSKPDDVAPATFPDPAQDPRFPGATIARTAAYREHPEIQERAHALLRQFQEMEELTLIRNAKMRRAMGRERY